MEAIIIILIYISGMFVYLTLAFLNEYISLDYMRDKVDRRNKALYNVENYGYYIFIICSWIAAFVMFLYLFYRVFIATFSYVIQKLF